jgi:CBS domain-containing membrane protein
MNLPNFLDMIGFSRQGLNFRETYISGIGGFLGIFAIFMSSLWLLDPAVAIYIVPSMGASAVLLFASPHSPFAQPWNVIAGHLFSAIIGVACWYLIPNNAVAASAAVGLAISVMVFTRSIHPPGGATALAAVIGSEKLHNMGYNYALQTILLGAVTILLVAIVFNGIFKWRRYPSHLNFREQTAQSVVITNEAISHEDFVYALSCIDTFVDIDEGDLLKIYDLATKRHKEKNNA